MLNAKQLWPVLLILAPACSEYEINGQKLEVDATAPHIQVSPEVIDFGAVLPGESTNGFFLVENIGDGDLVLGDLFLTGSSAFTLETTASGMTLEPGGSIDGMVVYTAQEAAAAGKVIVPSNDEERPEVDIRLLGEVGEEPVVTTPEPEAPTAVCSAVPPIVEAMTETSDLMGDQSSDPNGQTLSYTWTGVARPVGSSTVIPGPATSADPNRLGFAPDVAGTYGLELVVTNEDGLDSPPCYVEVEATAPQLQRPVAVCSVDPPVTYALLGSADLIGDQSYDPNGLTLTGYTWRLLTGPVGSGASTAPSTTANPNRYGIIPDVVGTYDFELVVTNSAGDDSLPCQTSLEAIPGEDLWVEMFWQHSGDDMDLHLTRAGGSTLSTQDCYYGNACRGGSLSWGPGGVDGDPHLDLDDISGTGPENINVTNPENVIYNVIVHDYPGSSYIGRNDVTVNIYISGALAWTDTRDIDSEGTYFNIADIDWTTRTVIPR